MHMRSMGTHSMSRGMFGLMISMTLLLISACSTTTGNTSTDAPALPAQQCGAVHTAHALVVP
ncbi:MAG: hypothetical protein ACRDHW_07895, partial [Ktedonobacteraceae bacterium]